MPPSQSYVTFEGVIHHDRFEQPIQFETYTSEAIILDQIEEIEHYATRGVPLFMLFALGQQESAHIRIEDACIQSSLIKDNPPLQTAFDRKATDNVFSTIRSKNGGPILRSRKLLTEQLRDSNVTLLPNYRFPQKNISKALTHLLLAAHLRTTYLDTGLIIPISQLDTKEFNGWMKPQLSMLLFLRDQVDYIDSSLLREISGVMAKGSFQNLMRRLLNAGFISHLGSQIHITKIGREFDLDSKFITEASFTHKARLTLDEMSGGLVTSSLLFYKLLSKGLDQKQAENAIRAAIHAGIIRKTGRGAKAILTSQSKITHHSLLRRKSGKTRELLRVIKELTRSYSTIPYNDLGEALDTNSQKDNRSKRMKDLISEGMITISHINDTTGKMGHTSGRNWIMITTQGRRFLNDIFSLCQNPEMLTRGKPITQYFPPNSHSLSKDTFQQYPEYMYMLEAIAKSIDRLK
jgi:hypothetical protein